MPKISRILTILLYCIIFAISNYVAQGLRVKGRETQETNSIKEYADVLSNGTDEICYPDKPNWCQSSSAVCVWVPHDKLYKCKTRPSKQHSHLKDKVNSRGNHQKRELGLDYKNIFPAHAHNSKNIRRKRTAASGSTKADARVAVANAVVIPPFEGLMAWDDDTEECIQKFEMAEKLQDITTTEADKNTWIDANKDRICDFKKFFHCYLEDFLDQVDILDDPTHTNTDPNEQPRAICQCYESSMTIVKDTCYIPARFGTKSTCGDHIRAPYPVRPWENAPPLKPGCTPNSECRGSQFYFGKRCECHHTAKFNYETHTCDSATKTTFSILTVMLLLMHFISCR